MKKRKKHTAWYGLEKQWSARKKRWYHNEADDLGKERFTVHRSPVNFFCCLPPFGLHAVEAEDVEGGHEENYYAALVTKLRSISPKDIGKISVRKSPHCHATRARGENAVVSSGDAGAAGYKAFAVSLEAGNASVLGEHCAAITLGEHGGAAADGNFSHAVALSHGSNAAASGPLGHAATFVDGWAISGNGNAVALGRGRLLVAARKAALLPVVIEMPLPLANMARLWPAKIAEKPLLMGVKARPLLWEKMPRPTAAEKDWP